MVLAENEAAGTMDFANYVTISAWERKSHRAEKSECFLFACGVHGFFARFTSATLYFPKHPFALRAKDANPIPPGGVIRML